MSNDIPTPPPAVDTEAADPASRSAEREVEGGQVSEPGALGGPGTTTGSDAVPAEHTTPGGTTPKV